MTATRDEPDSELPGHSERHGRAGRLPGDSPEVASAAGDGSAPSGRSATRTLLRLWRYVRPARVRLAIAALVAVVASCVGLVIPLALKWIVDGPVADREPGRVWWGGLLLLGLGVLEAGLFGWRRWLVARPLASVEATMRADLYRHLQRLPVSFHDRWPSGQLLSRGTADLQVIRLFIAFPLTFLLVNSVTIIVGFVILLIQDFGLGMVLILPAVPLVFLSAYFEKRYALAARTAQDQVGDLTTVIEEGVLGVRIVKGFGRHRSQSQAFHALALRLRGTELLKARLLAALWAVILFLPELAIGAALLLGTVRVADGGLSAGTLVAFLSTALALRWPVESIGYLLAMSNEAATAAERYFEVMDEPEPEPEAEGRAAVESDGGGRPATDGSASAAARRTTAVSATSSATTAPGPVAVVRRPDARPVVGDAQPAADGRRTGGAPFSPGDNEHGTPGDDGLRFEDVTFGYQDAPRDAAPLLRGVRLHVRTGETMALVGATGSGKTTLTALVPRLHEVTGGKITLDGVDIATMPRHRLRALVSVAFEEPTLFSASAGDNVLMGAPHAGPAELDRALDIAQAGFVRRLPHGVRTQVGEQGLSLSGGQRQRLALARAVVGSPRFLILDDPLSALDVHTEALVEAALREVLATTTALVVAHRPSTVLLADRVALLSGGRITAVGTHQELLRANAGYASLMSGEESEQT